MNVIATPACIIRRYVLIELSFILLQKQYKIKKHRLLSIRSQGEKFLHNTSESVLKNFMAAMKAVNFCKDLNIRFSRES